MAVVGERVALDDVADILPLDEHVGLADGVALGIQLLAIHDQAGVGVQGGQVLLADGEHAAGAGGGIVEGADDAGLGEGVVVLDEEEIHHQPDDFTGGEVLSGGLVGDFGELADQLLEHDPHLGIADRIGMEVDSGEFFTDEVQEPGLGEPVDLGVKLEGLEDVPDVRGEALGVGVEVFSGVVLVAHQLLHVEGRRVEEEVAGFFEQEGLGVDLRGFALLKLGEDGGLRLLEHAVEAPQDGERQDHLAILRLLVVAPEEVGDRPDEGREIRVGHGGGSKRKWTGDGALLGTGRKTSPQAGGAGVPPLPKGLEYPPP